jgi:hypothetical protein
MKKVNKNEFIERSNLKHNKKYDYSLINYVGLFSEIEIICPIHGLFKQTPQNHLTNNGCSKCSKRYKLTTEEFIEKAKEIHVNVYGYSLTNYINNYTKINIICSKHGVFKQKPTHHINRKDGCPKCSGKNKTTDEFIKECKLLNEDKYDYSLVKYINNKIKVKIICSEHGIFEQTPDAHLGQKQGCPKCNESKGEKQIMTYLINKEIKFIYNKRFLDCKDNKQLPFDFYLPDYNMCIEYDGDQHYRSIKHFGGDKSFLDRQKKDMIKTNYCFDNKIKLIRCDKNNIINLPEMLKLN